MTWEPRPLPEPSPESARYWEAATEETLLLSVCPDCDLVIHYPRALCPDCFSDTEWLSAAGTGTIYSYSVAESMAGWPEDQLPVIVAYIELVEGPCMLSTIVNTDPEAVTVGMPVEVAFEPTDHDDIAIPVFVPTDE